MVKPTTDNRETVGSIPTKATKAGSLIKTICVCIYAVATNYIRKQRDVGVIGKILDKVPLQSLDPAFDFFNILKE